MRYGIIYYGSQAQNRGLDQLCQSLITLGHQPYIVVRMSKDGVVTHEFNGVPVIQFPVNRRYFHRIFSLPVPLNFFWKAGLIILSKKYKWDGLFIRETPLSWSGIAVGKKLNIPVFLDIRENLGAAYESIQNKSALKRLKSGSLVRLYERYILSRYNHIFPSTKELKDWIVKDYRIKQERLSVLGNFPSETFLYEAALALNSKNVDRENNNISLVHAGFILENRGLQDMIPALRILKEMKYKFIFRIIGEGPFLKEIKKLVKKNNLEKNVKFIPMLPPDQVATALSKCDIGVCAYQLNEQTHQTLPGKLFEYMAVGLPVISSARKPVVRILEEVGCGLIYDSNKPENIVKALLIFFKNRSMRVRMGNMGREAIINKYNSTTNLRLLKESLKRYI